MEKWGIDEDNATSLEGEVNLAELGYQGNAWFQNNTTAYVGGLSTSIIIFNPETMQKTGKIDFSAVSNVGKPTDFPQAGGTIAAESVTELIVRNNLLFVALMPLADISTFTPGDSGCSIIIIDLTKVDANSQDNSSAVVKRISDSRGSATGAWGSGGGSFFMTQDENNDIYVLCHNQWAGWRAVFNKPACVLRIKNGATDFDANYYFDLETAAKGSGNPVINMEYYGGGKFLAAVQDPSAIDPNNPISYYVDPVYQWWSFDLYNKSATIVSENYTRGASASVCYFSNGQAFVPFENKTESYVMKVDLSSLESSRQFGTVGVPSIYSLD
jgi:hypothetical protein